MSHHVCLEGYELPLLTNGPINAASASDGERLAFSSHGWIWIFDIASAKATRLTKGSAVDGCPTWSPDGTCIAFARDSGRMLSIVVADVATGTELRLVTDSAVVLDPAFSADGRAIY